MSHGLHTQAQYLRAYHIRCQVIRTGEDQTRLGSIAADRPCRHHGRMAHGNRQLRGEAMMHGSDKRMHILHKMMSFTLPGPWMTVIVSSYELPSSIAEAASAPLFIIEFPCSITNPAKKE